MLVIINMKDEMLPDACLENCMYSEQDFLGRGRGRVIATGARSEYLGT